MCPVHSYFALVQVYFGVTRESFLWYHYRKTCGHTLSVSPQKAWMLLRKYYHVIWVNGKFQSAFTKLTWLNSSIICTNHGGEERCLSLSECQGKLADSVVLRLYFYISNPQIHYCLGCLDKLTKFDLVFQHACLYHPCIHQGLIFLDYLVRAGGEWVVNNY